MTSCLLLAAGFSSRFGSPKALMDLNGETIIEHLQQTLLQSHLKEVIVVLGAHQEKIKPLILKHKKIKVVYNKDYNLGQTSSFKAGLKHLNPKGSAMMLLPVDYPFVKTATIDLLIEEFDKNSGKILVPVFKNKRGHPPIFSRQLKAQFLKLNNDTGINTIIHAHENDTVFLSVKDAGVCQSFNTKEEFEAIRFQNQLQQES